MNAIQRLVEKKIKHGKEVLTDLEWYLLLDGKASEKCREDAAAEYEALIAWREFAQHQMACGACVYNCYDCEQALEIMINIRRLSPESKEWLDSEELDTALNIDTQNQT